MDLFDYNRDDTLLDIGCGGGATLSYLAERIPDGHLTGIDYSDTSVALSKDTNKELIASGRMDIVAGSVTEMPFPDDSFDKIITVESFYFWPTPVESLKEVRRVLSRNGVFMLVSEIYERPDLTEHVRDNIARYGMNVPGIDEFKNIFNEAGFSDISIHC